MSVDFASGGITTVDLSAASGRKLSVRWFNPRTGKFQSAEAVQGGNGTQKFKPPFAGDSVLHLRSNSE